MKKSRIQFKIKRVIIFALLFLIYNFVSAAFAETSGTVIKKIDVEGLYSIDREELLEMLNIKAGDILDPVGIRRGIKEAFLKEIFEDISVEADNEDKSYLKIMVREREKIKNIYVEGNKYLSKKKIRTHFQFKEGQTMRYDQIERSIKDLNSVLHELGFPKADARLEVEKMSGIYRVNLTVILSEGEPEIIKSIRIYGPEEEVISLMSISEGDVYDQFNVRKNLEKIKSYYKGLGYFNPSVGPYNFSYGELGIDVNPGKILDIEFEGNTAVPVKALMREVPFWEAEDFRDDLVEEAVSRIVSLYHSKGYPFAQVAPVIASGEDGIKLQFFIFEGDEVDVESIKFTGVTIKEDNLKEIMTIKEDSAYNPDVIDNDKATLIEFYNALGYLNADIADFQVLIKGSIADISIKITEGARTQISDIEIKGAGLIPKEEIEKTIKIKPGDPYNEVDISDSRYRIIDIYRNNGFGDIKVDVRQETSETGKKITFEIKEGILILFGNTVISGNTETKHEVIKREMLYKAGAPYNYTLLTKSRQRLYKLGLFTDVDIDTVEAEGDRKDIHIKVKEGNAGAVEFGVGYGDYEKYRGSFDVSYRNLWGMNRQISFRTELSSLEERYVINYLEPWFMSRQIPFRVLLMRESKTEKDMATRETRYKLHKYSANAGFERKLSDKLKSEIFYEYMIVKTYDVKPDVILTKEDTGTLAISSLRPGLVYDTRDNPFDPRRGVLAGVTFKAASSVFLSETDFLKAIGNINVYQELSKYFVAAVAFKSGVAQGYGSTRELPLVERFFLGGRTTVRGYDQDGLGPKGVNGSPTGGNAFVLGNLELRIYLGKTLGFVTFLDAGNVWQKTSDIKFSEMRYTAGLGIRYNTPVGPIRVDYGRKLDREKGESKGEIHFTIGHAF